jgi:UDP-hydrolysing UDP-N-acetyl-D-glucosamine 2-epimerase
LACFYYGIPIIHLAAGDTTQGGCPDDQLRFALSALASLHVCFSAHSRQRLQDCLGHTPTLAGRVLQVSSPVVESIAQLTLTPKADLCHELDLNPDLPVALVTQHPIPPPAETEATSVAGFEVILATLAKYTHLQVILTSPNLDSPAGVAMQALAQAQATQHHAQGWRWQPTLGRQAYLSWLAAASVVVGNTSSGLYETPCFGTPSISVGLRQAGRERAGNVLSVALGDEAALSEALTRTLTDEAFIAQCQQVHSPFVLPQGQGGTGSQRIADALASLLAC